MGRTLGTVKWVFEPSLIFSEDFDWKDEREFRKLFGDDFDWKEEPPTFAQIFTESFSGWP